METEQRKKREFGQGKQKRKQKPNNAHTADKRKGKRLHLRFCEVNWPNGRNSIGGFQAD